MYKKIRVMKKIEYWGRIGFLNTSWQIMHKIYNSLKIVNIGVWISLCLFMVLRALSLFYYLDKIYLRFGTIK